MIVKLPNGNKKYLKEDISIEEKIKEVEKLIIEWEEVIYLNWEGSSIRFFLNGLSNYLVWHKDKDDKHKEDKRVVSDWKEKEMVGTREPKAIPFSDLSKSIRNLLFSEVRDDDEQE